MKKFQLLIQRVENLENEQKEQDKALHYLKDLENLVNTQVEMLPPIAQTDEKTITLEITAEDIEAELGLSQPKKPEHGYVILLHFDPKNPTEWSEEAGGGWRDRGMGTRYENVREVKERLKSLKRQWPTYPLKIVKV